MGETSRRLWQCVGSSFWRIKAGPPLRRVGDWKMGEHAKHLRPRQSRWSGISRHCRRSARASQAGAREGNQIS
eukprot:283031-Pyramimonas_sp.AAC.1